LDCGTIMGFALSGVLSASPLGWPSTFYVPGEFYIDTHLLLRQPRATETTAELF